jgi:competence protein ComEC
LSERVLRNYPYLLAGSACLGLAAANAVRGGGAVLAAVMALATVAGAFAGEPLTRVVLVAMALMLAGWWWGSARLDALDSSVLLQHVGEAAPSLAVVTGPARRSSFELRVPAKLARFGSLAVGEPVLLELRLGRAPPQGAYLVLAGRLRLPRPASHGFDERTWLRRHGVHVVVIGRDWRVVGHRGGLGGYADRVRAWLARSLAPGLGGERRAVLEGIVLGEDEGLSPELRQRFRASGLYHLLAVSGQNVVFVAGGVLALAWLFGLPRWLGELGALAGIGSYVLAVGAQPSVIRAGIAGALGSLAWLSARQRDRWHFLLVGALILLAWNPYNLLDAGFQLSFVAVAAIFVAVPRAKRVFEGYPLPRGAPEVIAVSLACGVATAPILLLQFGRIPIYTVPANALAAPVVAPLLGLSLVAAVVAPLSTGAAAAIGWAIGWLAAYLVGCARLVGGLPGATVSSGRGLLALGALVFATLALALNARNRRQGG